MKAWARVAAVGLGLVASVGSARAQASAIPSATPLTEGSGQERGRKLLDEMVKALGGDAWVNRKYWRMQGKIGSFYKGKPTEGVYGFDETYRGEPFAERVVLIAHFGIFVATDHHDVAEVWNKDGGFEVTYKGKKALPKKDVDEFQRERAHSLDVVVKEWMKQPDVIVTYEGTSMVERHLADKVSILTATNDAVTLELEETSHLPLSLTYQYRDPVFNDLDTEQVQYDNYQSVQGVQTPYSVTRVHNGDMVAQRFVTKVKYESSLPDGLFDPDAPPAGK